MIDIGANLTHDSYSHDIEKVLARAWQSGVKAIVMTGDDLEKSKNAKELCGLDERLYFTCGIHPHQAKNNLAFSKKSYIDLLEDKRCVAIGECGLDYHRNYSSPEEQIVIFKQQLKIALDYKLPLFLHQRDALDDYLEILDSFNLKNTLITHCFTGDEDTLRKLLDRDSYIGITGWITDTNRNQDILDAVKYIPDDRLMIETDAPYLIPKNIVNTPAQSNRNEPYYLSYIVKAVSEARNQSIDKTINETVKNSLRVFSTIQL